MSLLSTRIQSVPGIARLAVIRGPASEASAIFQHNRAGDPVVGPSGPSIRSANIISYSRSIIFSHLPGAPCMSAKRGEPSSHATRAPLAVKLMA